MALLAVTIGLPCSSMAALPLVYDVETTGTNFPAPPLPTLGNLPFVEPLPDPFAWASDPLNMGGTRSTNFTDWSHRRAEMKAQIENYEIGYKPPVDPSMIFASYSGNSSSGTLTVRVTNIVAGIPRTLTLTCAISIPAGSGPMPAIIGMNSPNGSISLGGRAIATITYSHNQVTTYGNPQNSNPYYQLYAAPYSPALNIDNTGQYSAWAWGVSRIIDGLYKLNGVLGTRQIDLQRIGVTGCSYAGKMALFAGALDERIALTIPQESGGGGAPNWRYSYQMEPAGNVEGLAQTSHEWFKEDMFMFADANTARLPHDHHELMAMIAPRALFATGNPDGAVWLSNPSCYISCKAVERVYDTFGIGDRFGYNIEGGKPHCATTPSLNADIGAFLDKFLLGMTNINTVTNRHVPASYPTIDHARWTAWWGTTNPVFPFKGTLSLSIPGTVFSESAGTLVGLGTVGVTPIPTNDLVVDLVSSDTTELSVPETVTIEAGQSNVVFDLTVVDDSLLDGEQLTSISASNPLCVNQPTTLKRIQDDETTTLSVTLPASASESAGTMVNAGRVSVGLLTGANMSVALSNSAPSKLTVPATAIIPNGQTSVLFSLTFVSNNIIEGSQDVTITARIPNSTDGSASITITDDDPPPHHFVWGPISSQQEGVPFGVTIAAYDIANNLLDYRLPATVSALVPGDAVATNTVLNSPGANISAVDGEEYVLGYSFTPSTNLKVTHVRHFFGDKISIWNENAQLVVSQNVVSVSGTWVDTPLPVPAILQAGRTYIITVHENSVQYFWHDALSATFPDGTIHQSFWDYGDVFPTQGDGVRWYYVDFRYATDVVSVPVNPGATTAFSSGTWSGDLAVLQTGTHVVLQANGGAGYAGTSVPFNVLAAPIAPPNLSITTLNNSVLLSWPTASTGFTLERSATLTSWSPVSNTPVIVGDRYHVTNDLEADSVYYRLRKP